MFVAYLDPAAGGMIIQTLVAAAVAVPFILRAQISKGLNRFRSRKALAQQDEGQQPSE